MTPEEAEKAGMVRLQGRWVPETEVDGTVTWDEDDDYDADAYVEGNAGLD